MCTYYLYMGLNVHILPMYGAKCARYLYMGLNVRILPMYQRRQPATHSGAFAWKIPGTGEPSRLQSMGSLGVGQD